jgi:hypothetical protein
VIYSPDEVYAALKERGWVWMGTGPEDSQMAPGLLRKRVYGAAARLNCKASTTSRFPGIILGWLRA